MMLWVSPLVKLGRGWRAKRTGYSPRILYIVVIYLCVKLYKIRTSHITITDSNLTKSFISEFPHILNYCLGRRPLFLLCQVF